jgi:exosortase B
MGFNISLDELPLKERLTKSLAPVRFSFFLPAAAIFAAFIPTFIKLAQGPWQTEQEGHGPLIMIAAAWLAWQPTPRLKGVPCKPMPLLGWGVLLLGLAMMVICRSQDLLMFEVASGIPIIVGTILILAGWPTLRIFAFPIALLIFSVPPPDWMLNTVTVPLKIMISDWVTNILYALGYPVAQDGVTIMIGSFELIVKDACSGMNSIFALSAIGIVYIYLFAKRSIFRALCLTVAIIPVAIAANFIRVTTLVLVAYYFGISAVNGIFHDLTGVALFIGALALFLGTDGVLLLITALVARFRRVDSPAGSHL